MRGFYVDVFSLIFFFFFEDVCIQPTPFQGLVKHTSTLRVAQPLKSKTMFDTNYLMLIYIIVKFPPVTTHLTDISATPDILLNE